MVVVLDKKHINSVKATLEKHSEAYEIGYVVFGDKAVQLK